jgi:hypothetical protein
MSWVAGLTATFACAPPMSLLYTMLEPLNIPPN